MTLPVPPEAEEVRAARAAARRGLADGAGDRLSQAGLLDPDLPADVLLAVAEECGRAGLPGLVTGDLPTAAALAGTAAALLEAGAAYASAREVFGRPLSRFQVQRHAFALAAARLAASRALTWRAAAGGDPADAEAALPEAAEAAWQVAEVVLQVHGGTGYSDGDVAARWTQIAAARARVRARRS